MRPSFYHHLHPPTIPSPQARFRYTLGAGGISVYLTLVLLVTGILEMYYYVPTPEGATHSIQTLTFLVPYGGLVRNLHYWAAQGLMVSVLVHLLRVIWTGGYAPPRRFNYLLGVLLLVVIVLLDFTGYVLRWDEGVRWALVAGTNLLKTVPLLGNDLYILAVGGDQTGPATLVRFYAWHVFGLTLLLVVLAIWHLFRIRRDGGIAVPPPELRRDPRRITRFELARREGTAAIVASGVLILLATFIPAPLAQSIDPSNLATTETQAPWFFLWVQQLLKLGSPFLWGVLLPLGLIVILGLIPYILPLARPAELGTWFPQGNRSAQAMILILLLGILLLSLLAWLG